MKEGEGLGRWEMNSEVGIRNAECGMRKSERRSGQCDEDRGRKTDDRGRRQRLLQCESIENGE